MKHAASILAAMVATVLAGCQESNVTDPSATLVSGTNSVSKAAASENSGVIALQATAIDANTNEQYSVPAMSSTA